MAVVGNVETSGLSLSPTMTADLAGGMSVAAFNAKYAGPGFSAISTSRQRAAAAAPAAPAAPAGPSSQQLYDQKVAADTAARDALTAKQNSEQQGLFGQFTDKINNQEKLPALYGRLQTELGIPTLSNDVNNYKSQIYRVQGLLDTLDDNVKSRNYGYYTTQAMRDKIAASEGGNLRTELGRLGTGMQPLTDQLTSAQNQLTTLLPLYEQDQQKELQPITMQINALSDKFAREITGFNASREEELNNLMDKLQRDRTLSDRDWQAAQDLAKEQRSYAQQLALANVGAGLNADGSAKASPTNALPAVDPRTVNRTANNGGAFTLPLTASAFAPSAVGTTKTPFGTVPASTKVYMSTY